MTTSVPVVFADANVLYSAAIRDILIYLTLSDAIELHWSRPVLDELAAAPVRTRRATPMSARMLIGAMTNALPEAHADVASLPAGVRLPDPKDTHVLGAAIAAECSTLLTFNSNDFPAGELAHCGSIRAVDPDAFLLALFAAEEHHVIDAVREARRKLASPPLSPAEHLDNLRRAGLSSFSDALRRRIDRL